MEFLRNNRSQGVIAVIALLVSVFFIGFLITSVFDPVWDAFVANMLVEEDATTAFLQWFWQPGIPLILAILFAFWFLKEMEGKGVPEF